MVQMGGMLCKTIRDLLGRPNYTVMPNEVVEDFTFGKKKVSGTVYWQKKGVRNRLLTFGDSFGIFHGSWDDQRERQMVG